jgi:hypothetical protein
LLSAVLIVLNVFGAGFMVFTFPQTPDQAFVMLVPFVTLIIGVLYFLFPRRILHFCGVEAVDGKPHAIGEGRSSYAGILIACGAGCLFLQEPLALQPGLNLMLAFAWLIAGFGIMIQGLVDDGLDFRVFGRMLLSFILGSVALQTAELLAINPQMPRFGSDWVFATVAVLTAGLGLISLFMPKIALKILKLKPQETFPYAIGEPRGVLAGFYLSLGMIYLLIPQAQLFLGFVLAGAWLFTGIGRFISIFVDRGATLYNFAGVIFEVGIGCLLLALLFGVI